MDFYKSANNSAARPKNYRSNWLKYKEYVSSLIKLTPLFNIEADMNCSTNAIKDVLVEAATISTPQ